MREKDKNVINENYTQKVIDPESGRDVTAEYVNQRLKELENIADALINSASKEYLDDPSKKTAIYKKYHEKIHSKLGMGSIGPATAAAGPLMEEKQKILADVLKISGSELL